MQEYINMTTICSNITGTSAILDEHCAPTDDGNSSAFMEREWIIATMVHNLRYYIEGVILTPVATIGLFGKFTLDQICFYLCDPDVKTKKLSHCIKNRVLL